MTEEQESEWFFCIIQNPGTDQEQLMGFKDTKTKTDFIPSFKTKKEAEKCFLLMPKDIINLKYEIQAFIKEDLLIQKENFGHKIFLLDEKGQIINELEK